MKKNKNKTNNFFNHLPIGDPHCSAVTSSKGSFLKKSSGNDSYHHLYETASAVHLITVQSNHTVWLNLKLLRDCKQFSVQVQITYLLFIV